MHLPQLMVCFILYSIESNNLVYTLLMLLSLLDVTNLIPPQIWSFSESLGKDSTFLPPFLQLKLKCVIFL